MDHESAIIQLLTEIRDTQRENMTMARGMVARQRRALIILFAMLGLFIAWSLLGKREHDTRPEDSSSPAENQPV